MGVNKRNKKRSGGAPRPEAPPKPRPTPRTVAAVVEEEPPAREGSEPEAGEPTPPAPVRAARSSRPAPAPRSHAGQTPGAIASARMIAEADALKIISTSFEDDSSITYESSRIPWWVRLMWLGFWALVFFYIANYLWPDAQRYFTAAK